MREFPKWIAHCTSNHAHDYRLTKPDGSPLPVNAPSNDRSEQRAFAKVLTAAPDMLEALDAIETDLRAFGWDNMYDEVRGGGIGGAVQMVRAAIAKARSV